MERKTSYFTTNDGVKLHYQKTGQGAPLIFLNGYSGRIRSYRNNYEELEKYFTVYTLEYRAHGESEVPQSGMFIARFAKDFAEFIDFLGYDRVNVAAHSMGNAVFWCYTMLFGQDKINKYILIDEAPTLVANPSWTTEEKETYMGHFNPEGGIWDKAFFTHLDPKIEKDRQLLLILKDHLSNDWRSEVKRLTIPTLILMGGGSHFASEKLWNWLQTNIKGSKLVVIPADAGGTHNLFLDNPEDFNQAVINFLQ